VRQLPGTPLEYACGVDIAIAWQRAARADLPEAAWRLASVDLPVLPVDDAKRPMTRHGYRDARHEHPDRVARWIERVQPYGIAIATGARSNRCGLLVVDLDRHDRGPHGLANWDRHPNVVAGKSRTWRR